MGNKIIDDLINALDSSDESTQVYAIEDLCDFKDERIVTALINRLEIEKSQLVREKIVDALKNIISPEMFTIIYNMFGSKDAFTRNAATMIFAGIGDESVNYLEQSFFNSDDEIKKLILDSLFGIGTPNARKAIRHGLNDNSMNVLISSIEYLGLLSDTESNSRFIEILKSADQPMLKITLLRSISKICDSNMINQAVEILLSGNNYYEINNLYLGEILNLAGEVGSIEDILKILDKDFNHDLYSEEISALLLAGSKRFPEITSNDKFREALFNILNDNNINGNTLLNIIHLFTFSKSIIINEKIEKLMNSEILREKKFRNELIELLNEEWYGINT